MEGGLDGLQVHQQPSLTSAISPLPRGVYLCLGNFTPSKWMGGFSHVQQVKQLNHLTQAVGGQGQGTVSSQAGGRRECHGRPLRPQALTLTMLPSGLPLTLATTLLDLSLLASGQWALHSNKSSVCVFIPC